MAYDKDQAQTTLKARRDLPVKDAVYRHYKGGLYVVLSVGLDEETGEVRVSYRSNAHNTEWSRTLANWDDRVLSEDAGLPDWNPSTDGKVPRFRREVQ